MKLQIVLDFLAGNGYEEKMFKRKTHIDGSEEDILPFGHIFINSLGSELYIIEEKNTPFQKKEIEEFENIIFTFLQFLPNRNPLKYNINLLLLCPLRHEGSLSEEIDYLVGLERNKFTCRKIILDTSKNDELFRQDELSMLPSFPVQVELTPSGSIRKDLLVQVKEIVKPALYTQLIKINEKLELENILSLLGAKEENENE